MIRNVTIHYHRRRPILTSHLYLCPLYYIQYALTVCIVKLIRLLQIYHTIFLRLNSQENQTPQEVRQEVLEHLKQIENLDKSIPSNIVLGPFLVSVEEVRQSLVNKRRALANAVLNRLALRLRQQMQDVSHPSVST